MKIIKIAFLLILSTSLFSQSFYNFEVFDIDSNKFELNTLKGKKILVVNVASKCGYTKQYADLEKLYTTYKDSNFVIIAFPANNFLKQEPGTNSEIKEFCSVNYGVSFPMMAKISVKGDDIHPLYEWLTTKEKNLVMDSNVKWNFQKYMINEDGSLYNFASPRDNPLSEEIINWITK